MQITQFYKGLNTRTEPHLIASEEGVIYKNIDNQTLALKPLKQDEDQAISVANSLYYFNSQWLSSTEDRDYVEFQTNLYYSNGISQPQKTSDGTTFFNLGIVKPAAAPTTVLGGTGNLTGTYQYAYTYYNVNDGTESQPSEYSADLVTASETVDVTVVASTDPQVTNIRLYRIGGNLVSAVLVVELTNTSQTYNDNIADIDVIGTALASANYKEAPSGLSFLTEFNTMLFGALDSKLRYSDIAFVNYWSDFNFIDFDEPITGLGPTANGLIVFTANKTFIVTGNSPDTLSKYLVSARQGCKLHKSIQYVKNTLVWVSNDGICATTGGEIQVVTQGKLGKVNLQPIDSAIYDNEYYLQLSDRVLVSDFRYDSLYFKDLDIVSTSLHYASTLDALYYSFSSSLYEVYGATTDRTIHFKSGWLTEGVLSNRKNYNNLYCYSTGTIQLMIYIDSILVQTIDLVEGFNDVLIPTDSRYGYYLEYEVIGTGTFLELEFTVEGRQDG